MGGKRGFAAGPAMGAASTSQQATPVKRHRLSAEEHRVLGQAGCSGLAAEVQRGLGHGDELAATASQLDAVGEGLGLQLPHQHEGRVPSVCADFRRHPRQGPDIMTMYDPTLEHWLMLHMVALYFDSSHHGLLFMFVFIRLQS